MTKLQCYIWKTPATEPRGRQADVVYADSPRAGGRYGITGSAIATIDKLPSTERARLTTWLCNKRRAGLEYPLITSDMTESAKSLPALNTTGRVERALLYFNDKLRVGEVITVFPDEFTDADPGASNLAAVTESETKSEVAAFLALLVDMGLLIDTDRVIGRSSFTPTANGWLKIDELVRTLPVSSQAFVAMWFNETTNDAFSGGVEPAILESGYRPVRIDNKEHINKIDDEIVAEIRRSKFLVADFTCEKEKVRGGVYFEAGYAMALPIPIIWTCSKDSIGDLHFDTRQYNHIIWDSPETLRRLLRARIGAVIGQEPLS